MNMKHKGYNEGIIFLDFDGVLNTECFQEYLRKNNEVRTDKFGYLFAPEAVANLAQIIEQTGASVVITSSWKIEGIDWIRELWNKRQMPGTVVGMTEFAEIDFNSLEPSEDSLALAIGSRGSEIASWMNKYAHLDTPYAILDDINDFLPEQQVHFIRINPRYGITKEDALHAIDCLKQQRSIR